MKPDKVSTNAILYVSATLAVYLTVSVLDKGLEVPVSHAFRDLPTWEMFYVVATWLAVAGLLVTEGIAYVKSRKAKHVTKDF